MQNVINSFILRTPNVCGGRLRLDGTRITVAQISLCYKQGYTPEEISGVYPHLSLAQVYAALAYYHANKEEIENELAFEKKEARILEAEYMKNRKMCYADSTVY